MKEREGETTKQNSSSTLSPQSSVLSPAPSSFSSTPTELSRPRDDQERHWLNLIRRATQYSDTEKKAKDKALAFVELERQGPKVVPFWMRQFDHDNVMTRVLLEEFLNDVGPTNAAPALIAALDLSNDKVRSGACYFIGKFKVAGAVESLRAQLSREKVRAAALKALGDVRAHDAVPDGIRFLTDPQEIVRIRAAGLLGKLGDSEAAPNLIVALEDPLWDVRYAAETALIEIGKPAVTRMLDSLQNASDRARAYLIEALGGAGDWRTANMLRRYLNSSDWVDRGMTVQAIARLRPSWAHTEFERRLKAEENEFVRSRLMEAIEK